MTLHQRSRSRMLSTIALVMVLTTHPTTITSIASVQIFNVTMPFNFTIPDFNPALFLCCVCNGLIYSYRSLHKFRYAVASVADVSRHTPLEL